MPAFRDILVAVVGLTPQVITETVYYLTQVHQPPATLAEIHVLTTHPGQQVVTQLLHPLHGHFHTLCTEYGLDASTITFELHVLKDAAQVPLEDIRTAADSAAVADQIAALVRCLTADSSTRLYASLAGGRKTQSVLLGFALQLYGRPQDVLLHVLVEEDFQSHREFFYPPKASRWLRMPDGRLLDACAARIDVAEIPYLRLRDKLLADTPDGAAGFAPAIAQMQQALDTLPDLPPLVIACATRCLHIGAITVSLKPVEMVLYAQLAHVRLQQARSGGGDGHLTLHALETMREEMLQRYAGLYGHASGQLEALRARWQREGLSHANVRTHFSNIKRKLRKALPESGVAAFYEVSSVRQYGQTRYGLLLPAGKIELHDV